MVRWIAFDQETTSFLHTALARGTKVETLLRGPVDYALARPGTVVAVLPATGSPNPGIAVFRRSRPVAAEPRRAVVTQPTSSRSASSSRTASRAGGFLGLSDEAAFEEEAPPEKKTWWQKFWDE